MQEQVPFSMSSRIEPWDWKPPRYRALGMLIALDGILPFFDGSNRRLKHPKSGTEWLGTILLGSRGFETAFPILPPPGLTRKCRSSKTSKPWRKPSTIVLDENDTYHTPGLS